MTADKRIVIDIGNTTIAYGVSIDGDLVAAERITTDSITDTKDIAFLMQKILEIDSSVSKAVACVGVEKIKPLLLDATNNFGIELVLLDGINTGGATINYDTPNTLGPDRVANAIAGSHLVPLPALIIDCGTAINIDYIDKDGTFCGGAIVPGIDTSRDSLTEHAPSLPKVELSGFPDLLGTSTETCIKSGILNGAAAVIDTFISRTKPIYGIQNVILTGGSAKILMPLLNEKVSFDEWFTLTGLSLAKFDINL